MSSARPSGSDGESSVRPAHFTANATGEFEPTTFARSHWGDDHLNGPAVVGLAAYALEDDCVSDDFMPARLTVSLFRAARRVPTAVTVRVVRDGRRVRSAECEVAQAGWLVARATLLQYRRTTVPPGQLWTAPMSFPCPPPLQKGSQTAVHSDAAECGRSPGEHQNDSRKRFCNSAIDVVAWQLSLLFLRAVMVAEATSLVTNIGTHGVGYINGNLTVGLARLPVGEWIDVQADSHWAADGVAVGTATLFDARVPSVPA